MFKKENLRKNFLRVKQNIDQNLGRAEKSEVLSEDQQENEKRVDAVKHAFQNIVKKAGAVLQAPGTDYDKRLKKLPEAGLGQAMIESVQALGQDTLLGNACQLCGDCQVKLAREQVEYEITVEQEFINPLQGTVDVDIPSIMKLRKALNKSTLDMDSAKTRFNQAVRQSHVPGANMANAAAKADVIREEFEEASQKVENIKDSLSIELCNFASKESEQSKRLLMLLEAQANYHKKALEAIKECIPQMKLAIQNSPAKPCYGMPLDEHLRLMCRDVALVLEACVLTLLDCGMEEEGLFRIAGSAMKLKKLKACFDANAVDMEDFSSDPHTVAGALKQYLRELPEPLLTYALYDDFLQTATLPQDQRLQTLWTVINRLPKANYNNFRYLVKFLAKLAEKSDVNKMTPSNIAIVIGPNLLWSEKSNAPNMMTTGTVSAIIEAIVTHADWFFPGAFDFHLTGHGSSPLPCKEPGKAYPKKSSSAKASQDKEKQADNVVSLKAKDSPKKDQLATKEAESSGGDKDKIKILPVEQSSVSLSVDIAAQKARMGKDESLDDEEEEEDASSDENNPFSSKFEAKPSSSTENGQGKSVKGEDLASTRFLIGGRRSGRYLAPGCTNTGDYDNVVYSINPQNPMYRSSNLSRASTLGSADRRGSADSLLTFSRQTSAPVPPSRPSRPSKRSSPQTSEQNSPYSTLSRSISESPHLTNQSLISTPTCHTQGSQQPSAKYLTGSTPNISSLSSHRVDDDVYGGIQGTLWNRPQQRSDFHSLKRGSDPCIIPPPPQFTLSHSRPLKISRSQLGPPPNPGAAPRSQCSPQSQMSRSQPDQSQLESSMVAKNQSTPDQVPVDKSFHQDTYSTAFALASLGAGNKSSDYLTRVRAMWDDRHQQPSRVTLAGGNTSPGSKMNGGERERVSPSSSKPGPVSPRHDGGATKPSNTGSFTPFSHRGENSRVSQSSSSRVSPKVGWPKEIDFNVGYLDEESHETSQAHPHPEKTQTQNSVEATHAHIVAPSQQTAHNTAQQASPRVSPVPSLNSSASSNLPMPSDSPEPSSPVQKRFARKPAPPPPPDRPFTVMVTATTATTQKPGNNGPSSADAANNGNNNQSGTWPRTAPLASPESPSDAKAAVGQEKEKQRISGGHSERPSMPPPDRPERPRVPPTLNPPAVKGHQRSASAGAVVHHPQPGSFDNSTAAGVPNAGSLSSYSIAEGTQEYSAINEGVGSGSMNSAGNNYNVAPPGSTHALGRHFSLRPRPTPPPPPPPVAKESEDTKL